MTNTPQVVHKALEHLAIGLLLMFHNELEAILGMELEQPKILSGITEPNNLAAATWSHPDLPANFTVHITDIVTDERLTTRFVTAVFITPFRPSPADGLQPWEPHDWFMDCKTVVNGSVDDCCEELSHTAMAWLESSKPLKDGRTADQTRKDVDEIVKMFLLEHSIIQANEQIKDVKQTLGAGIFELFKSIHDVINSLADNTENEE